ncbi:MAG: hypothetical protein IKA49_01605 [Alistipes sp.]|nr:hypothetical protein [Alistipes sp.]
MENIKKLISAEQVISLAFGDGEYISAAVVGDADIASAEARYILPIVGESLYEELHDGEHESLLAEYVAPALAMAVRCMLQPALNVRTGMGGLSVSTSMRSDSSTKSAIEQLQRSLVKRRQMLLRRLSDYLKQHAEEFPSYDESADAMQRCRIDGGYVQTC